MLPSTRVMMRFPKKIPNSQSRMLDPTSTHKSKLVMPVRRSGVMEAEQPSTQEYIEEITSDDVSDGYFGVFLQGGYDGGGEFG